MPPMILRFVSSVLVLLIVGTAVATRTLAVEPPSALRDLPRQGPFRPIEVIDGDTVLLDNGREVRFVGIQAPKLPLGRKNFRTWPLADEAKAAVEALLAGRRVFLHYGGRREDRHGRLLAHLVLEPSEGEGTLWVQGQLLTAGMARVYSFFDNRSLVAEMLGLEEAARAAGAGIWSHPFYRPLDAEALAEAPREHLGRFALVEGRVRSAAVVRGRGYLNFGRDWKRDFTASLAPRYRKAFESEGISIKSYEGLPVRIRGWLKSFNGPMIEITHPEQIEVLRK